MEGTRITHLELENCSFSDAECAAMMANGLGRKTSAAFTRVVSPFDEAFNPALAVALESNSTLRVLSVVDGHFNASTILLALGKNTGLKCLSIEKCKSMDESLCTAMEYGLRTNETLRELQLLDIRLRDDNFALWRRALSFLRVNKALRTLRITMEEGVTESCASAFRMHIAAMLQDYASLENLSIGKPGESKVEEFVALLPALRNNTTLTGLCLNEESQCLRFA
jgi:hypothetical protein